MKIKVCGFYKGQFTFGTYSITAKDDIQALNAMRAHFVGYIKAER